MAKPNKLKTRANGGRNLKTSAPIQQRYAVGNSIGSGYDAADNRGRRRVISTNNKSEDKLLRQHDRDKVISTARSLVRNSSIVSNALDRHLNFTSTFLFQCRSPDKDESHIEFCKTVEALVDWWSRPLNCDAAGQDDLYELIRLIESLAFVDGDVFIYKLDDGTIQLIEGDRVRSPDNVDDYNTSYNDTVKTSEFIQGVRVDAKTGKSLAYAICDRLDGVSNGYKLSELVSAEHVLTHGYRRRKDQKRGVTRLAGAINSFLDVYEAQEYALAKMKAEALVALKIKRGPENIPDDGTPTPDGVVNLNGKEYQLINEAAQGYDFDFGGGNQVLDMEGGDDAMFLNGATPSSQFQEFLKSTIEMALKAFEQPYCFYNEKNANYSSSKVALAVYWPSVERMRDKIRVILHNLTVWRLTRFIADGDLVLPDGWTMTDVNFSWVAPPMPSIDAIKEEQANTMALANGTTSRQRICAGKGQDYFAIIDEKAREEAYAAEKGVSLGTDAVVAPQSTDAVDDEPEQLDEQPEDDADEQEEN